MPQIVCPHCQAKLRASSEKLAGRTVRCPKCQRAFVIPGELTGTAEPVRSQPETSPPPSPSVESSAQPESPLPKAAPSTPPPAVETPPSEQTITCPHCSAPVILPPELRPDEALCPHCDQLLAPAAAADQLPAEVSPPPPGEVPDLSSPPSPQAPSPASIPSVTDPLQLIPRISTWLVVLLTVCSAWMVYPALWLLHNQEGLNRLRSSRKLSNGLVLAPILMLIGYGPLMVLLSCLTTGFALAATVEESAQGAAALGVWLLMLVAVGVPVAIGVLVLVGSFRAKGVLEDHLQSQGVSRARLSALATFFFHVMYLQYKINQLRSRRR